MQSLCSVKEGLLLYSNCVLAVKYLPVYLLSCGIAVGLWSVIVVFPDHTYGFKRKLRKKIHHNFTDDIMSSWLSLHLRHARTYVCN